MSARIHPAAPGALPVFCDEEALTVFSEPELSPSLEEVLVSKRSAEELPTVSEEDEDTEELFTLSVPLPPFSAPLSDTEEAFKVSARFVSASRVLSLIHI